MNSVRIFFGCSMILVLGLGNALYPEKTALESFTDEYEYALANNEVSVYSLRKGSRTVGNSVWISRASERVNAKYFADAQYGESVYNRFQDWKQNRTSVIALAGAYSTSAGKPDGLTVDAGEIVNRSLADDKDALVIIYATGGVVVSDMDEGNLYISGPGQVNVRTSAGRTRLLNWVSEQGATMFQTHLLAYRDKLRINSRGRTERANRRIMVLAEDDYENIYHIIFDLQDNSYYLYDAAKDVMDHLQDKSMKVIAMMNFDTGAYDIFQIYDDYGNIKNSQSGLMPISKATNLLTYFVE